MKTIALLCVIASLTSCFCPGWLPWKRPLFDGLDTTQVPPARSSDLADAREDFVLARRGLSPRHAVLVNGDRFAGFRNYQGCGYDLTAFWGGRRLREGAQIVLHHSITGTTPFRYDDSHEWLD